jgi:hypothetical protein
MASFFKGMIVKRQNALFLVRFTMEAFYLSHHMGRLNGMSCGRFSLVSTELRSDRLRLAERDHCPWKGGIEAEMVGVLM